MTDATQDSVFYRLSQISRIKTLPKFLIECDVDNKISKLVYDIIPNFSEDEWKVKKIPRFGEYVQHLSLKFQTNKHEHIVNFKKRFAKFSIITEKVNVDNDTHTVVFRYSCIEDYAKLQTTLDFTKWMELGKHLTIPQIKIYFLNKCIKEYVIEGLTEEDLKQAQEEQKEHDDESRNNVNKKFDE